MSTLAKAWAWVSSLVSNNPKSRYAIFAFALVLVLTVRCAHAGEVHLEVGASVVHGSGPYLGIAYQWLEPKGIGVEAGLQLYGREGGVDSNWAPSGLIVAQAGRFGAGIGVTHLVRADALDGGQDNLALKLRMVLLPQWALVVRHVSCAGACPHNVGRNVIALDWTLR